MVRSMPTNRKVLASGEELFHNYVKRLARHRLGRLCVHLHMSKLMPENRKDTDLRGASQIFQGTVAQIDGQFFQMSNGDLLAVFKEDSIDSIQSALVKLRFMFADDPLMVEAENFSKSKFATLYRLQTQYDKLLALAQVLDRQRDAGDGNDIMITEENREQVLASKNVEQQRRSKGVPMDPDLLARVEKALAQTDLSSHIRRQTISAVVGKAPPQEIFTEVFVSIGDLRETMLPDTDMGSSPWLFQHLTETLDQRVLSIINRQDDRTLSRDISINLNVGTIMGPEFLAFDDNLGAGTRGSIVLEMNHVDIFANLSDFLFARDFVHERGYRICIDGLNHRTLPFINRKRLGADMVKLIWNADMERVIRTAEGKLLKEIIQHNGASRVILCRVEEPRHIEIGQYLGLTMFQGRHVEALLVESRRRRRTGR